MAANPALIKQWIQFLKNNQIAELKSDPKTGNLSYRRPVTTDDVANFLDSMGDYSPEQIENSIQSVMSSKSGSALAQTRQQPQQQEPEKQEPVKQIGKKRFNNDSAEDIDFKDVPPEDRNKIGMAVQNTNKQQKTLSQTPDAIRKRKQRELEAKRKKAGSAAFSSMAQQLGNRPVNEAIADNRGPTVSEDDVEAIFAQLTKPKDVPKRQRPNAKPELTPDEKVAKRQEDLRQIKRIVRDVMTDAQRRSFWRQLNDI